MNSPGLRRGGTGQLRGREIRALQQARITDLASSLHSRSQAFGFKEHRGLRNASIRPIILPIHLYSGLCAKSIKN